ncbi:hypothetical protein YTPLAS21_10180 [Candidatus Nitrosocosmicus sp.]|uniref:hypothetical protein n=1 Tax=Candidatus Nitrosocosmicus sp. FF01 TaxID=3397670 RepID=UPI002ACD0E8E|nr:hypothetical protein YTPLAS21_10180 [Candidatus Nitrosocosmicus sp.]
MTGNEKANEPDNMAHERPKKHLFLPSGNFMWEIRSKKNWYTYFIDSNREYCTCKGYYYNYNEKKGCYHLKKIMDCIPELKYEVYLYHDDYAMEFLKGVILRIIPEQ